MMPVRGGKRLRSAEDALRAVVFRAACAALLGLACTAAQARSEAQLRACLQANLPQRTMVQTMSLTRADAGGETRQLALRWYWRERGAAYDAVLRLLAPQELAGGAYLFRADAGREEFHVYLPALRKVRRVTGASAAASLFGSGLSAFDLKLLTSGLHGGQLQRLGVTQVGTRSAEQWRYLPPADPMQLYDRIDLDIDDAWCLPLRAQLYGGVPWKTLNVDVGSVQRVDGRWLARRARLDDLREGSRTQIDLSLPSIDGPIDEKRFSPRAFWRAD